MRRKFSNVAERIQDFFVGVVLFDGARFNRKVYLHHRNEKGNFSQEIKVYLYIKKGGGR